MSTAQQATEKLPKKITPEGVAAAAADLLTNNPMFKVGSAEIRGNTYRIFENAPQSLVGLFMHGASHGDKDFLIYEDEVLSFRETWERAVRFAHALKNELGIKQGDRVAIAMRNYPEWCIAYMGIIALGGVVVPLNAWWKTDELKFSLKDCEAKTVIVDAKRLGYLTPIKDELGLTLILAREEGEGADYRYDALLATTTETSPPVVPIEADDDFCVLYTSGSTGAPKGVILTHRGVISTLLSWAFIASVLKEARGGVSLFGENPGILLGIPLFHVTGSHSIFLLSYVVGRRISMMYKWTPQLAIDLINKHGLTNFVGVPSQSYELIDAAGDVGIPTMLEFGSGGAKRPPEHVRKLKQKFKNTNSSSGYGLSETNAIGCVISFDDYQERPDSTGRPVPPLTDIKVVNDNGDALTPGEVGEVWIRSPGNFRGYLNMPEETAKALTPDGWFRTGDLGRFDDDGFLYIVDRIKDMIIRGGENISCLEVENRAYEFPAIEEASVFSVPCDELGERVGLVVVSKAGEAVEPEALRSFMADGLAGFKVPERIWVSPQPLPRLGTGKFDKRTVKMMALQYPPSLSV